MNDWLAHHLGYVLSATSVLAGATGFIVRHLGPWEAKRIQVLNQDLFTRLKDPVARQLLRDVEAAIVKAVPDSGDARYASAADLLLTHLPSPEAIFARPLLIAVLSSLGAGAKSGLSDTVTIVPYIPSSPSKV